MSLKAFHIVFVTLATLLAFAFAGWCLGVAAQEGGGYRVLGIVSGLFGAALIAYGVWFWRTKIRSARLVVAAVALPAVWLAGGGEASACSVCYGAAEGQMINAARMGVWLMVALVGAMQVSFGVFFVHLWRRARKQKESLES